MLKTTSATGLKLGSVLPIARDQRPVPKVSFSDSVYLASGNIDQSAAHYLADKQIFWSSFVDYSIKHPQILQNSVSVFINSSNADIFSRFPITIEVRARFAQNEIIFEPMMAEIATLKVPSREIHHTTNTRAGTSTYTGQNFQMDLTRLKLPGGMQELDLYMQAIASDIWSMVIHAVMHSFQSVPSMHNTPERLYPYDEVPVTVEQMYDSENLHYGALNKGPQGIQALGARVNRVFERHGLRLDEYLMTRECANFINTKDLTNLIYDKSGLAALGNRANGNVMKSMHGVGIMAVQLLEPKLHSQWHDNVLRTPVVTGGRAVFAEKSQNVKAKDYKHTNRDIRFSSWTADKMETHSFAKFLNHCPEFVPLNSERCNNRPEDAGGLNMKLLFDLADKHKEAYNRTRCAYDGNEEELHQFLAFRRGTNRFHFKADGDTDDEDDYETPMEYRDAINRDSYFPLHVFGEISRCHLNDRYLGLPVRTMEYALTSGLSDSQKQAISNGIDLAKMLSNPRSDKGFGTFVSNLANSYGMAAVKSVRADSDLTQRERGNINDSDTFLGVMMSAPDRHGNIDISSVDFTKQPIPWGMGTISGFLSLYAYINNKPDHGIAKHVADVITAFVPAFEKLGTIMCEVNKGHAALDPRMVPLFNNNENMDDFTRTLHSLWINLVHEFQDPLFVDFTPPSGMTRPVAVSDKDTNAKGDLTKEDATRKVQSLNAIKEAQKNFTGIDLDKLVSLYKRLANDGQLDKLKALLDITEAKDVPSRDKASADDRIEEIMNLGNNSAEYAKLFLVQKEGFELLVSAKINHKSTNSELQDIDELIRDVISKPATDVDFSTVSSFHSTNASDPLMLLTQLHLSSFNGRALNAFSAMDATSGEKLRFETIIDDSNTFTRSRNVIREAAHSSSTTSSTSRMPNETFQDDTVASTILSALPYLDPRLPWLSRAAVDEKGRPRALLYRNGGTKNDDLHGPGLMQRELFLKNAYTKSGWDRARETFAHLPNFVHHCIVSPLGGFEEAQRTLFDKRWADANKMPLFSRIAAKTCLMQPVNLRGINSWSDKNVAIPLGGQIVRPFQTQFMESLVCMAQGEIGKTYFSGMDSLIAFDPGFSHMTFQNTCYFKEWIENRDRFFVQPFVRGTLIVGGKGNKYINECAVEGVIEYGSETWQKIMEEQFGDGEKLGDHSMIPVLQSYNSAIENPFTKRHIPLAGWWNRNDYVGRIHVSNESFPHIELVPRYSNQFLFNHLFDHFSTYEHPYIQPDKASFNDIARRRSFNRVVHQITQYVFNPAVDNWEEVASSAPEGDEKDGIVGIQNSTSYVDLPRLI